MTHEQMEKELKRLAKEVDGLKKLLGKKQDSPIASVTGEKVKAIADKYKVSVKGVESLREELELYCQSTGKRYKNYEAALTVWVRRAVEVGKLKKEESKFAYEDIAEEPAKEMSDEAKKQLREMRKRILKKA